MKLFVSLSNNFVSGYSTERISENDLEFELTIEELENFEKNPTSYTVKNNLLVFSNSEKERQEFIRLKNIRKQKLLDLLFSSDYKIIKCYEASLLNKTLPYNIGQLSKERDDWRKEINQIEVELNAVL
jgi:hypothetical protein